MQRGKTLVEVLGERPKAPVSNAGGAQGSSGGRGSESCPQTGGVGQGLWCRRSRLRTLARCAQARSQEGGKLEERALPQRRRSRRVTPTESESPKAPKGR